MRYGPPCAAGRYAAWLVAAPDMIQPGATGACGLSFASHPTSLRSSVYHQASAGRDRRKAWTIRDSRIWLSRTLDNHHEGDRAFICPIDDLARRWRKSVRQAICSVGVNLIPAETLAGPDSDRAVLCQAEAWRQQGATHAGDAASVATASVPSSGSMSSVHQHTGGWPETTTRRGDFCPSDRIALLAPWLTTNAAVPLGRMLCCHQTRGMPSPRSATILR